MKTLNQEAMTVLARYSWPGNVRQVVNVIERLAITGREAVATVDDLPAEVRVQDGPEPAAQGRNGVARWPTISISA